MVHNENEFMQFKIHGKDGFMLCNIDKLFDYPSNPVPIRGFDSLSSIAIEHKGLSAKCQIMITTNDILELYRGLRQCFFKGKEEVYLESARRELIIKITFLRYGFASVNIKLLKRKRPSYQLAINIISDKQLLYQTLGELHEFRIQFGRFPLKFKNLPKVRLD